MTTNKTRNLIHMAFFAALTAVLSQISIPLPFTPVPINLATLSFFLAGAILGPYKAATSQLVYTLLGVVGLPVFANFSSGIGVLLGPTGGFIVGYSLGALLIGIYLKKVNNNHLIAFSLGLLVCYLLGIVWFMITTKTDLFKSFLICILPFILGDAFKILVALPVAKRLKLALS